MLRGRLLLDALCGCTANAEPLCSSQLPCILESSDLLLSAILVVLLCLSTVSVNREPSKRGLILRLRSLYTLCTAAYAISLSGEIVSMIIFRGQPKRYIHLIEGPMELSLLWIQCFILEDVSASFLSLRLTGLLAVSLSAVKAIVVYLQ